MNTLTALSKATPVNLKPMDFRKKQIRAEGARLVGRKGYLGISYHVKGLMDFPVEIDIPGKFSIYNSLTAIAICRHFKVSEENIIKALKEDRIKAKY